MNSIASRLETLAKGGLPDARRRPGTPAENGPAAATGTAPAGAETLRELADELRDGGSRLAGSDLLTAYPPDRLLPDRRLPGRTRLIAWLGLSRDVSVFLPIGVTWWQLWEAIDAYRPQEGKTFFDDWRNGYGSAWPMATTAGLIALLIGLVMMLSVLVHILERSADRHGARTPHREALAADLALATVLLTRTTQPTTQLATATELKQLAASVQVGSESFATTTRQISESFAASTKQAGESFASTTKQNSEALASIIEESVESLAEVMEKISTEIKDTLSTHAGTRLHEAITRWTATADDLAAACKGLEAPAAALQRFTELREKMAEEEKRLREELRRLITDVQNASKATVDGAQRQQAVATEVANATRTLAGGLEGFNQRTNVLGQFINEIRQILAELESQAIRVGGRDPGDNAGGYRGNGEDPGV